MTLPSSVWQEWIVSQTICMFICGNDFFFLLIIELERFFLFFSLKKTISVFHHLYDYAIYYFNLKDILLYLMFNIKTHFMLSYFPLSFPWRFCSLVADWTMWLWRHVLIIFLHNCIVNFCITLRQQLWYNLGGGYLI